MNPDELREQIRTLIEEQNQIRTDVRAFAERTDALSEEDTERFDTLTARYDELEREIPELEGTLERVSRVLDSDERATEPYQAVRRDPVPGTRTETPYDEGREMTPNAEVRAHARQAIETDELLTDREKAAATALVARAENARGDVARHIIVTGRPDYRSAFGKLVFGGGAALLSDGERQAVEQVRALNITTGADGGFALPFHLDPTIIDTGDHDGLVASMRSVARVVPGTTDKWHGLTADGVTASYGPESREVPESQPTIVRPEIVAHKADVFTPYTIEAGQDWAGLVTEIRNMFQVAKADLEEDKFAKGAGDGSNEPFGLMTRLAGSAQEIATTGVGAFVGGDVYRLQNALPARFRPRASWLGHNGTYNSIRQLDTAGGHEFWGTIGEDRRNALLGRPVVENPFLDDGSTVATGEDILVFGDLSGYIIYDRVGMAVEMVPHLFDTANNRPKGERGIYAYWRNGADLIVNNGVRSLTVA